MGSQKFAPSTLSRRDASGQIARQLREAISSGIWLPGDRLPSEQELSETFEVSRTTVREALKLLSATGLVYAQRGAAGGSFVAIPQRDDVAEQLSDAVRLWYRMGNISVQEVDEARWEFERICVRKAAENRTDEDILAMREPLEAAKDFSLPMRQWLDFDIEFHGAISSATHNKVIELAMLAIHQSRPATNEIFIELLEQEIVWQQHSAIVEAIVAARPDEAERALKDHVDYLAATRQKALKQLHVEDVAVSDIAQL